jgi:hypothetical protein
LFGTCTIPKVAGKKLQCVTIKQGKTLARFVSTNEFILDINLRGHCNFNLFKAYKINATALKNK